MPVIGFGTSLRAMFHLSRKVFGLSALVLAWFAAPAFAQETAPAKSATAITQGQRIYSVGHSFHVFMPPILQDIAQAAGITNHTRVGLSSIGGSRVIQHWDVADDKNKSKESLRAGKVDVLTLAPIFLPDPGIENFAKLALEGNPNIRITVQEFWLPHDWYEPPTMRRDPKATNHSAVTIEELRQRHAGYFEAMDAHVRELNQKLGKPAISVVPVGQAVLALREKIVAGEVPGLKTQDDLFTDAIGHAKAPLQALVAYCHFAVTYRRSPVGLKAPATLGGPKADPVLVKLLQELAWQAAIQHPLSGVKGE